MNIQQNLSDSLYAPPATVQTHPIPIIPPSLPGPLRFRLHPVLLPINGKNYQTFIYIPNEIPSHFQGYWQSQVKISKTAIAFPSETFSDFPDSTQDSQDEILNPNQELLSPFTNDSEWMLQDDKKDWNTLPALVNRSDESPCVPLTNSEAISDLDPLNKTALSSPSNDKLTQTSVEVKKNDSKRVLGKRSSTNDYRLGTWIARQRSLPVVIRGKANKGYRIVYCPMKLCPITDLTQSQCKHGKLRGTYTWSVVPRLKV